MHAQRLASINRNACCFDIADYLVKEHAGRIVEIQLEGTAVRSTIGGHTQRFTEMDGSQAVSARVVVPHAVSERVSPLLAFPNAQADVAGPRIHVRVVNLSSAGIPQLVRFLDGLTTDHELDVPKADDGRGGALVSVRRSALLCRTGLSVKRRGARGHCGQGIATRC